MVERTFMDKVRAFFGVEAGAPVAAPPRPLPQPSVPEVSRSAEPAETVHDERLPDSSLAKVVEIRRVAVELELRAVERGLFDETMELKRLKGTHLPRLLQSYVDIPPEHRAEVFRETGRSASYLLNERLDKILHRLEEMSRQLARNNLDAFQENIRFVDNRYGESANPFD